MKCKFSILKILVLFAPFLFCMRVNAQALPTPSADTFSTILNGNDTFSWSLFSDVNVLPLNPNPTGIYRIIEDVAQDPLVVGSQLNLMQNNDYTVSQLTQTEIDNFSQVYPYLYDVNGNTVTWDNVYHLHYMNAMFHGDVYIDSDGNILTSDQNNTKTMFQLGIGGYLLQVSDIANIYDQIALQLNNNNMLISLNPDIDISSNTMNFYVFAGLRGNYNGSIPWYYAQELFLPNIYNRNLYYVSGYSTWNAINLSTPTQIYCVNNPTQYLNTVYNQHGSNYPVFNVQNVNYTYDGITYNYLLNCPQAYAFRVNSILSSKENFTNNSNLQNQNCVLNYNGFNYDPTLCYKEDDVLAFKVLQPKTGKIIQINDDLYSYDDIKELEENLNNITSTPNELYDPDQAISENNYPLDYPYEEPEVQTSELPFPATNINPSADPFLSYDPLIQPTPEATVQSFWNFQIPFVENLFKKYPFSIPWDIKNFFLGFTSQAQAPAWDFDYTITIAGKDYTTHFEGDLSDYEPLAVIFRNLITISFIIFLAVYSYFKHS